MKPALVVLGVHAIVSAALFLLIVFGSQAATYYSAIVFFLVNAPGFWPLMWLGLAPLFTQLGFASSAPLILLTTQALLAAAIYAFIRVKRKLKPNSTIEGDARNSGARPSL